MSIRYFFFTIISLFSTLGANAQETITLLRARGTGQTTGHIITLSVRNTTSRAIEVSPDVFYLPSDGRHQSYVGRIPEGIVIPPGGTIDIPATGYCTDIHTPPVPDNAPTLSGDQYVVIGPPSSSSPDLVSVFPTTPVAPFSPASIPAITNSPGFKPLPPALESTFVPTWPISESSIPIGGTMLPDLDPRTFGPLIVTIVEQIENTSSQMQAEGSLHTPFSGNPAAELDAVIQQTTWLVIGLVTGETYDQEDFAENVYEQFTSRTGAPVSSLPEEEKERLDSGVADFWNTFTAVGLEAKVISHPQGSASAPETPPESESTPEAPPESEEAGGCKDEMSLTMNPPFAMEMKIAKEWGDAEERQEIMDQVAESLSQDINLTAEGAFISYDISTNPTSSTAFWKGGHIGGFAAAYAKTWFTRPDGSLEWVWGTDRMDTDAGGTMEYSMTYTHDETCRAMVAGTAVIRVKATSSAFDPVAGNTERQNDTGQINFLWWTRFAGAQASQWLVARGRGRTKQSFREHMTEQLRDQLEGDITDALQEELLQQAEQHLGGLLETLGLSGLDLADLELPDFEMPGIGDLFEEVTGIELPDLEAWLSDGMETAWNLPFVANTYATANGILNVQVGGNEGRAQASTSVFYNRQNTEKSSEAIRWSGDDCQEAIVSDAQADALTIRTVGQSTMVAEAVSRYGFGNGHADAQLESMNLQILVGICICPGQRMTEPSTFELAIEGNLGWYTGDDSQQEALQSALDSFRDELQSELTEELNGLSRNALNNLSTDQFESMVDEKVSAWADAHPFAWNNCR